ncbi:MAG: hypothetical protein B6230_02115 [Desulfobacteraceae bacterium 4572_89]|nr:MAG: hypothetical protein B6230_02115 [Desulfobacteraceae bacterium 4572_89]
MQKPLFKCIVLKTPIKKNKHKNRGNMHTKNIRRIVIKQLKYNHPRWKKMSKKSKKELLQQVMDEATIPGDK